MRGECKFCIALFAANHPNTNFWIEQMWLPIFWQWKRAKQLFAHENWESSALFRGVWCQFALLNTLHTFVALGLISVTCKNMTQQERKEIFCPNPFFPLTSVFPSSPSPRGESNFWAKELNFHWRKILATRNENWKDVTTCGLFWIRKTETLT